MACLVRLNKEFEKIKNEPVDNISVNIVDGESHHWIASIIGPKGTPYEDGIFNIDIKFPHDYPFRAPSVRFLTQIYHPNINLKGEICLDILRDRWSASLTVRTLLLSICSLLGDPNIDDPLMAEIANLMKNNRKRYTEIARDWTLRFAGRL